ncbi:MAG: mechanosensitive ion channel family protein [Myxococcota bacterium]
MQELLDRTTEALAGWPPGAVLVAQGLVALVAIFVAHRMVLSVLDRLTQRGGRLPGRTFRRLCGRPLLLVFGLAALRGGVGAYGELLADALNVALVLSIGWLALRGIQLFEQMVVARLALDVPDNLQARRIYTQIRFLRRLAGFVVVVLTGGVALMSLEPLRQLGAGLLTSAGVAGVVIGFAAQRTVGNLIAGFQIAFTQPIRTDDVVIVEGEWGRIEEITLTYVVVRIWDDRRLVVPISHFIEKPFQNWTRVSADLLGTVFLHVDYRASIDALRAELQRLLEASEYWDGRVSGVQVTGAGDQTLEVRALVSARNSGDAWELRCQVREGLVRYLNREHPEWLPRVRAEVSPAGNAPDGAAPA